jgi:hypothetical protein
MVGEMEPEDSIMRVLDYPDHLNEDSIVIGLPLSVKKSKAETNASKSLRYQ